MHAEREIQRQNEYLRHTIDSSAQRIAREMQEAYSRMNPHWEALITSPVFEAMQRIQESSAALRAIVDSPALRAAGDLGRYSAIWSRLIDLPAQGLISETNRQYQQLINSMSIPALQAISNHTLRYFESASAFSRFPESFVGQILDRLQGIADIEEEGEDVEREAELIEELFNERVGKLRPDFISREGMIQILVAIVILWYSMYEGIKTEKRIVDVITQTESRLLGRIEALRPQESKEVFYVVLRRPAQLRTRPSTKKPIIETLYPNQRVSLIERKGKWIHVKYFDYIDGVPKSGWTFKKYLRREDHISRAMAPRTKARPQFGSGKGLIKMSDDFDEPLKDFEEYS
jgi:hypothetical protein